MPGIIINQDKCVGCGLCVDACPFGAIVMENGKARIIDDKCTLCGACVSACNFEAIELLPMSEKLMTAFPNTKESGSLLNKKTANRLMWFMN